VEKRVRTPGGEIRTTTEQPDYSAVAAPERDSSRRPRNGGAARSRPVFEPPQPGASPRDLPALHVYVHGVARNRLQQAARRLNLPLLVEAELDQAQALLTLKNYYRRRPRLIVDAERMGISIYVLRANTITQVEDFLVDIFGLYSETPQDPTSNALREVEEAIRRIRGGERSVDLAPQDAYIRRKQHDLARAAHLVSHSYGTEPNRRVRIFRDEPAR